MFLTADLSGGKRSPDDDFWYTPLGAISQAGVEVTPELAQQLTVVYACNKVIAESVGQLPLHLYKERADGRGRDLAREHPLYRVLHSRPNKWQTAIEFREMMQGHATMKGNGYARMLFRRGFVSDLIPLHPDRTRVELVDETTLRYIYANPFTRKDDVFEAGEVFHLKGMGSNGYTGFNPIELQRESIGAGLAMQAFGSRFFKNNAQPGGWLEYEGKFEDIEAKRKFRSDWESMHGGINQHRVAVLELGMKYHELAINNKDAQFLESRKYSDTDIARIFRVPPHKIGILDKATFSNIESQSIEFVTDTLMPWLVRWEQAIERDILLEDDGLTAKFAVHGLLRGDAAARASYYKEGVINGWFTRNEVRGWEELNPLEGLDEPMTQMNMTSPNSKDDNAGNNTGNDDVTDNGADDAGATFPNNDGRMHAVMLNAAQRVVNKELIVLRKAYKQAIVKEVEEAKTVMSGAIDGLYDVKHVNLVIDALVCDEASALDYVRSSRAEVNKAMQSELAGVAAIEALLDTWEQTKALQMLKME